MEVTLTQYIRPNGTPREVHADISDVAAEMAEDMTLSCEVLTTGEIAIYVRYSGDPEEKESMELAVNEPHNNDPVEKLEGLIREVYRRRHAQVAQ